MLRLFTAFCVFSVGLTSCGNVPFSVNPEDRIIAEGTEIEGSTLPGNIYGFKSLDPSARYDGMAAGTECGGSATVSGAQDAVLEFDSCTDEDGVSFWVDSSRRNKFWLTPLQERDAGDLTPYDVTIGYQQVSDGVTVTWRMACTVTLTSSIGYRDNGNAQRAVWQGNASCPNASPSYVIDPELGEVEGTQPALEVTAFEFVTDFARTCGIERVCDEVPGQCSVDSDCALGLTCDVFSRSCETLPCGQCTPEQICYEAVPGEEGSCSAPECSQDDDCDAAQRCLSGVCT